MGYFGKAFVFTERPDWNALKAFGESLLLRGYRHKQEALWLLDVAKQSRRPGALDPALLCGRVGDDFEAPLPAGTQPVHEFLTQVFGVAQIESMYRYGLGWLALSARIAHLVNVPTYFLVGDDEFYDAAWTVQPSGEVSSLGIQLDDILLAKDSDGWSADVLPDAEGEDGLVAKRQAHIRALRSLTDLRLRVPHDDPRPYSFYYFPNSMWPKEAPLSAEDALGLTWDLFERFDGQYDEEFRTS